MKEQIACGDLNNHVAHGATNHGEAK